MTIEQKYLDEEARKRRIAEERERLLIKKQEDWFDSPEYREAKAAYLRSANVDKEFDKTDYYRCARLKYRNRING